MTKAKDPVLDSLLKKMKEQELSVTLGGFEINTIPTGIPSFDRSTGIGGLPAQRVILMEGEEASGKTLLLLRSIATAQANGDRCAFVDLEQALTPNFARMLGVDYDKLVISRPRTLNEAYDVGKFFVESGIFSIVGFDSAVALATIGEIDSSSRSGGMRAGKAQVHAEELSKIISVISSKTVFIITNHLRENPNPPNWWRGGKMLYSPGGRALRHASSMTIRVSKGQTHKEGGEIVGHEVKTYIVKNKVGRPYERATFDLYYETGIDTDKELIQTGLDLEIVQKSSSWFTFNIVDPDTGAVEGEVKANGLEKFIEAMESTEGAMESLSFLIQASDI